MTEREEKNKFSLKLYGLVSVFHLFRTRFLPPPRGRAA